MRRGEIWWAQLDPPAGTRPVLLLSRDEAYVVRSLVTVAPVTTRVRRLPAELPLSLDDGMPRTCVANLDSMTTIRQSRLLSRITTLTPAKLAETDAAIHYALGLEK